MTELLIKNTLSEILFDSRVCESVEDMQIIDYLYENLMLERLLYGEPVTVPELRNILHNKIVNFEFIKLNGEIRPARGTTMMKYIPTEQHPKGIRPSSPKVATFYDLRKEDWRSVSQRSKEIVLKKDEETGKPVVMVKDKPVVGGDVAVRDKGIEKVPVAPEKPIKPIEPEQPEVTIDQEPYDKVFPEKPPVEIEKVEPVESTETKQMFHFVNPVTGATQDIEMTPKDAVDQLKKMSADWRLQDEEEYQERERQKEEEIEKAVEEPEDVLQVGDVRNYLNRKGQNVIIKIVGQDPEDGGFYAKTPGGGRFKIPAPRMQNIGQKVGEEKPEKPLSPPGIIKPGKDLENTEATEI